MERGGQLHHHGYLWAGPKQRFDDEALRRPPHPDPPPVAAPGDTAAQRIVDRYREVVTGFPVADLPPLEPAYWLMKPSALIRGTWRESKEAAAWLGERLAEYAPRLDSAAQRDVTRMAALVESAAERLYRGADVSLGLYLERPTFLSLTLVTCSPNRAAPDLACPAG